MKKYDNYTNEQLELLLTKYKNRRDLCHHNRTLYTYTKNNGLLDKVLPINHYSLWSYNEVYNIAKKYNTYIDFYEHDNYLCKLSNEKALINTFSWLSKSKEFHLLNKQFFIYAYIDKLTNSIYIGLTHSKKRFEQHKRKYSNSAVYNYFMTKYGNIPEPIILETNLSVYEASTREIYWVEYYKEMNYTILNRMNAGSIGGLKYKWNDIEVIDIMKKCKNKTEFRNKHSSAFNYANNHNLFNIFNWNK